MSIERRKYGYSKIVPPDYKLDCHDGAETITLNLHKVLFVPEIKKNLLCPSNDLNAS